MPKKKPANTSDSLFGWLGRQIGHVKKAVKTDVTKPKPKPKPKPTSSAKSGPAKPTVVFRNGKIEEADHPTEPGVKLRRTTIDEVIVVDPNKRMK
jgi:hypothetical protein